MKPYKAQSIEKKWQKIWEENGHLKSEATKGKYYILDMFPYPSGDGLHVGHVENYTATDILSRYKRMNGFDVMHPIGWDAFGLPAENFAIKTGIHPDQKTHENIRNFTKQIKSLGMSYDWDREIDTSSPEYYKWTQWMFLFLYKNGLAYKKKAHVNWCPKDATVLANEQVVDGKCDRCGTEVVQKDLEQWFFKITDFVEDMKSVAGKEISGLLSGLDKVDWPHSTKAAQANWIGRSEGTIVKFEISQNNNQQLTASKKEKEYIEVFTTRVDTIFGCTYVVIAPEHPLIESLAKCHSREVGNPGSTSSLDPRVKPEDDNLFGISNLKEVEEYLRATKKKTDLERTELNKDLPAPRPGTYFVYVMLCDDESMYIGQTDNLERRWKEHVTGTAARHTKLHKPLRVIHYEELESRDDAVKREQDLKTGFGRKWIKREFEAGRTRQAGKTGVKLEGVEAINPFNGESVPVFVADYVLGNYGTGAVMAVPAHDERDYEFAKKYLLPVRTSITPISEKNQESGVRNQDEIEEVFTDDGVAIESGEFTGLKSAEAREKMTAWLEEKGLGAKKVNYRLRDWLISRQRYWGAPIPIIYCDDCGAVPVPEKDLPVKLPTDVDFRPTGESPLLRSESFQNVTCPTCGKKARREADTMDTFVCSSWYYLRFADPNNAEKFADAEKLAEFLPVDFYMGGAEHTVLHLLYARFFTKALAKYDVLQFDEPFAKLRHQGMVIAEDGRKMSKSLGNVVNPDEVIGELGADTLRLYEMFMGPLEDMKTWNTGSVVGLRRFLERAWRLQERIANDELRMTNKKVESLIHRTIKKVTDDIENLKYNTAISSMMICLNELEKEESLPLIHYSQFLILLSPFAPHIAEELWESAGNKESIFLEKWPEYDEEKMIEDVKTIVIQINGKVRANLLLPTGSTEETVKKAAMDDANVQLYISGKEIRKVIYIQDKILNLVV